jgi:hypothetical protein
MRGLLAGAILAIASAGHADACSPVEWPTPRVFASAHVVAKAKVAQVVDSKVPYALVTFDTLKTYSGEARSEWQVVWQKGFNSLGELVPFVVGQTYIVGLIDQNRRSFWSCPGIMLPCPRNSDGEYYPQIMTHCCHAPASLAFPFSRNLEAEVIDVLEAAH